MRLRFVGDFEGLYRSEADPWGQSGADGPMASYYKASREGLCTALTPYLKHEPRGLEVGCGKGWSLQMLRTWFGGRWDGMDISPTAAKAARANNSGSFVFVSDIASECAVPPNALARYDVVILSQMLWYVLTKIDDAMANVVRLTRVGGFVVVQQAFLREQLYGARIADGWRGALALFIQRYPALELIEARYDDSLKHACHDGLMIFRKIANE
jgi:SAM-dependent methyltransferase